MSRIKHAFRWNYWFFVAFLSTILAVYMLAGRAFSLNIDSHRADVESELSRILGHTVTIEQLQSRWYRLDPSFSAIGIQIDAEFPVLVESARIHLSFFHSLRSLAPRFESIQIDRAVIPIEKRDKRLFVLGQDVSASAPGPDESEVSSDSSLIDAFSGTDLVFNNTVFQLIRDGKPFEILELPELAFQYTGDSFYASGEVVDASRSRPLFQFSLHGESSLWDDEPKSRFYAEVRDPNFVLPLVPNLSDSLSLSNIDGTARIWAALEGLDPLQVLGELQFKAISWKAEGQQQEPLKHLASGFHWQKGDETSVFAFDNIGFNWGAERCDSISGMLTFRSKQGEEASTELHAEEIYIDRLNLDCLGRLAIASKQLSPDLESRLKGMAASGFIEHLNVNLLEEGQGFLLEAELSSIALDGYQGAPGANNLNAFVRANDYAGFVDFDSANMSLFFPELFDRPWALERGSGRVYWSLVDENAENKEQVSIFSDGLKLALDEQTIVYGDFNLDLTPEEADEDLLSLAIAFQNISFPEVVDFVPGHSVDRDIYDWLDASLIQGNAKKGIYVGYGSVESESPDYSFTSSLDVTTENGVLRFDPDWPPVEELNAQIYLQNSYLEVDAHQPSIAASPIGKLEAFLPETPIGISSTLYLKADTDTSPDARKYWFTQSPLRETLTDLDDALQISGSVPIDLQLTVPFSEEDVSYEVDVSLQNNEVVHRASGLSLKGAAGEVQISSESGVVSKVIEGRLFDEVTRLSIDSKVTDDAAFDDISISFKGEASIASWLNYYDLDGTPHIAGSFPYEATLSLTANEDPSLSLRTNQKGMTRHWPSPFGKSAEEEESLDLLLQFADEGIWVNAKTQGVFREGETIREAEPISAVMALSDNGVFQYASVGLGVVEGLGERVPAYAPTLMFTGEVKQLEAEPWVGYLSNLADHIENRALDSEVSEQGKLKENTQDHRDLRIEVDLLIGAADFWGQEFSQQTLIAEQQGLTPWILDLQGPELKGKVYLPHDQQEMVVELDLLDLQWQESEPSDDSPSEQYGGRREHLNEEPFAFGFSTKTLLANGNNYGSLSFHANQTADEMLLEPLALNQAGVSAVGSMRWIQSENEKTELTLQVTGKDTAKFLKAIGKAQPLSSEEVKGSIYMEWPQGPVDFDIANTSGRVNFEMKDGFLNVPDKEAGALKLMGIFNAETIGRRLRLDFSDIYKSGIGYDELSVKANIESGVIGFTDPVKIKGPSSEYEIKGFSNLAEQTLDLRMEVRLPIGNNLPLAAWALGVPQIGGAVWLADKLLGEPLSDLGRAKYKVKGTWDAPRLEEN